MHNNSLKKQIFDALAKNSDFEIIKEINYTQETKNELVFFLKPESFDIDSKSQEALIEMVEQKFQKFGVNITGSFLISGTKLKETEIMDRHYGYINQLSKNNDKIVTADDLELIKNKLGLASLDGYKILGGHRFLAEYPSFDEITLNDLWQTRQSQKVRGGFYFEKYLVNGDNVILINGFHPSQLQHFTRPDHRILVMILHTDTNWSALRNEMIGATVPELAVAGSIRGDIFRNKEDFGLKSVTVSNNFVHLSAGAFEGCFEVNNFISSFKNLDFKLTSTNMYRLMNENGHNEEDVKLALQNPEKEMNGKTSNLFSVTEDMETIDAIELYFNTFC